MNGILRASMFFALFVMLGLAFGFLTFNILSFSRTVEVPGIVNQSVIDADRILAGSGLSLKIEGEDFDAITPAGKIIRQDVPPGKKVKERRAIRVVISKGPKVSYIPLMVNEKLEDAEAQLLQKGLRIGKIITVHSDTAERGIVIAQDPEPDDKLTGPITVLVSDGPHARAFYCPDFLGRQIVDVQEIAGKMAITVQTHGEGTLVAAQKPKPGMLIRSGDTLYVELKEVPVL